MKQAAEDSVIVFAALLAIALSSSMLAPHPDTSFLKLSEPTFLSERKITWRFIAAENDLLFYVNEALARRDLQTCPRGGAREPLCPFCACLSASLNTARPLSMSVCLSFMRSLP